MVRFLTFSAIVVLALMLFVGCQQAIEQPQDPDTQYEPFVFDFSAEEQEIESFSSQEEYDAFIATYGTSGVSGIRAFGVAEVMAESAVMDTAQSVSVPSAKSDDSVRFSGTNTQEVNVDEADIIKTDGEYIYIASEQVLSIVAHGDEPQKLYSQKMDSWIQGMFLEEDTLIILSAVSSRDAYEDIPSSTQLTAIQFYDVSDVEDVALIEELVVEGNYNEARLIDGQLYVIATTSPQMGVMPLYFDGGIARIAAPDIFFFPQPYDGLSLTTITKINVNDASVVDAKAITTQWGQQVYMSEDMIVVSWTSRINEWKISMDVMEELVLPQLSPVDARIVQKIKDADPQVLSLAEKDQKIMQIVQRHVQLLSAKEEKALQSEIEQQVQETLDQYAYREYTDMVALSLDLEVLGEAKIGGSAYDQFAFSERDDILRVVTTTQRIWNGEEEIASQNHIYTLDQSLEVLDHVDGIAKGERIFSARYVRDMLYMVTFRQVDPFFVVDLSDPQNIDVLGELKIPGFSRYLHPISDDLILGLGRDATAQGRQQGVKLSLFDVSDPTDPIEIDNYVLEDKYSSSGAEWEHKAFLYDAQTSSLVIPYSSYDYKEQEGVNGALVFDVSEKDIDIRGLVAHGNAQNRWQYQVQRSLFIDDTLYTMSNPLLRANDLLTLESIADIELSSVQMYEDIEVY